MKSAIRSLPVFCSVSVLFFSLVLSPGHLTAVQTDARGRPLYHSDRITVKLKAETAAFQKPGNRTTFGIPELDRQLSRFPIDRLAQRFRHRAVPRRTDLPDLSRIHQIIFDGDVNIEAIVQSLQGNPAVEYVEPIPIHYPHRVPNDSLYALQPFLEQIFAEEAWDIHRGEDGAEPIIIGISDTGVEWYHSDLIDNIWQNLGEDADGDGHVLELVDGSWQFDPGDVNDIDDDGNGYPDDFIGWDFLVDEDWNQGPDPDDYDGHGTHVAGLAAAVTNNTTGVSSISWNVRILCTSHSSPTIGAIYYGYDGIIYLAESGADIINCSWGSLYRSRAENEAIAYATGLGSVIVASAGNDNIVDPHYPSSYPNVVSVAAVGNTDEKASYSTYGMGVDISAPGGDTQLGGQLLSTYIYNGYESYQGTSMAGPVVAGVFGLLKSYHPEWSAEELITQVLGTADPIDTQNPGFEGQLGAGRVNAYRALTETDPVLPQALRLELIEVMSPSDEGGDKALDPGETASLNMQLQNSAYEVGGTDVTFILTTESSDIQILDDQYVTDIPPDDYFLLEDAFSIRVEDDIETATVRCKLQVQSAQTVYVGREMSFDLIIAPSGMLVFDVSERDPTSSGAFIRDFLELQGYDAFFTTEFPLTLNGFETVFLCLGNVGMQRFEFLNQTKADIVNSYLESGGNLYLEGGVALGGETDVTEEIFSLFGLSDVEYGQQNDIGELVGQDSAFTAGMRFTGSSMLMYENIDLYTPDDTGIAAFEEVGYGIVGVQNTGEFGQHTFCSSYPLGALQDVSPPSTRFNFFRELMEFFGYDLPVVADFGVSAATGHAPLTVEFTDFSTTPIPDQERMLRWDLDGDGKFDKMNANPNWTYNEPGSYDVTVEVTTVDNSQTITREEAVTVMAGESALEFPGLDGWSLGYIPSSADLNFIDQFTAEAWIYPTGWGPMGDYGFGAIMHKGVISAYLHGSTHSDYYDHSLVTWITHENGQSTRVCTPLNSIALNTWQHIAISYHAGTNQFIVYIDGVEQILSVSEESGGPLADNLNTPITIGNNFSLDRTFDGKIDEVRFWNVVRTPEDIDYHRTRLLSGREEGLMRCFPMNEGQGGWTEDIARNGDISQINCDWVSGLPLDLVGRVPRGVYAVIEGFGALIRWEPPLLTEDIQEYRVYRKMDGEDDYTFLETTAETWFQDPSIEYNQEYSFVVSAMYSDGTGEGPLSNQAKIKLTAGHFPVATNLLTWPEDGQAVIGWDPPVRPGSYELAYDNGDIGIFYGGNPPEGDELFAVGYDVPANHVIQSARLCLYRYTDIDAHFRVYITGDSLGKPNVNDTWFAGTVQVPGVEGGSGWCEFDFRDREVEEETRLYILLKLENYSYFPVCSDTLSESGYYFYSDNLGESWGEYPDLNFMFRLQVAPAEGITKIAASEINPANYLPDTFREPQIHSVTGTRSGPLTGNPAENRISSRKPPLRKANLTVQEYRIYQSTEREGPYTLQGTTSETAVRITDLMNGQPYYFKVDAVYNDPAGESLRSEPSWVIPNSEQLPVPVNPVAGKRVPDFIPITWYSDDNTATGYEVYRSTTPQSPGQLLGTLDDPQRPYAPFTDYLDEDATAGTDYYYRIRAVYDGQTSEYSIPAGGRIGEPAADSAHILPWASDVPDLDGLISSGEEVWANALKLDMRMEGMEFPATVYLTNDGDYLYAGLDDPNNSDGGDENIFNVYFDTDGNGSWPNASGIAEGSFGFIYSGYSLTRYFRRVVGFYPDKLQFGSWEENPDGVEVVASMSSGHLQYEIRIDLATEPFQGEPGSRHRLWFMSKNQDWGQPCLFPWQGAWPQDAIWVHPATYPQFQLATTEIVATEETTELPDEFALMQNYPNPFNPTTTIRYAIPYTTDVSLVIYNMLGQRVRSLVATTQEPGWYDVVWDGLTGDGQQAGSGIYFYRLHAGDFTEVAKMTLLR